MRLNWAGTARRRAKLRKQLERPRPPLDKQTDSGRRDRGGRGSYGSGRGEAARLGLGAVAVGREEPPVCRAEQASQKVGTREEAQGSTSGSRDWGGREADLWTGGQGPKGDWHKEKMEKQVEGGGDSEKREGKKSAPGEGLRRGGGWRRAVTERKGKERWRNERGEARGAERRKIGEESRRGVGDDRNENERVGGELEAPLPPPRPAALPPERALQPPALTLSQLRGRHSAWIVFPKLLFYKLARGGD